MSIDKVEVTNSQGNLLVLSLEDISNGFVVEDIEGLGPVRATLVSSKFAAMDGEEYQSTSRGSRNILLKLGYAPNFTEGQTVWSLRSQLYQFFMTGTKINFCVYMLSGLVVNIEGRVETCEPAIFTREPQMDISIICFKPDFIDPTPVQMHDVFNLVDTSPHSFFVAGSVKTGISSITFTVPESLSEFTIYHTTPSSELRIMHISAPMEVGDVVNICTIKGSKSISLTRDGISTSLMWAVSPQSIWVLLEQGTNQLYISADTEISTPVLVDYYNWYGGL